MLLFLAERLFGVAVRDGCEDAGIAALRAAPAADPFKASVWIPVAWAFVRMETLLGCRLPLRRVGDVHAPIVAGWALFTFLSLVMLLEFGRSSVSYAMKFAHVFFELSHLAYLCLQWRWVGHALGAYCLGVFALAASLTMPCEMMLQLTALGAVLDTANYVLCLLKTPRSREFNLVTIAFGWHATYIWAFLLMTYSGVDEWVVPLRVYGVWANGLAVSAGAGADTCR